MRMGSTPFFRREDKRIKTVEFPPNNSHKEDCVGNWREHPQLRTTNAASISHRASTGAKSQTRSLAVERNALVCIVVEQVLFRFRLGNDRHSAGAGPRWKELASERGTLIEIILADGADFTNLAHRSQAQESIRRDGLLFGRYSD